MFSRDLIEKIKEYPDILKKLGISVKTYKTPTTSGSFTQWNIPTSYSGPWCIASPGGGQVWFTESSNKIGLLN